MQVLENLWFGNLCPCEQFIKGDHAFFDALHKAANQSEAFLSDLPLEVKKKIEKLMQTQMEADVIAEKKAFITGFRLGVQIILASLSDAA